MALCVRAGRNPQWSGDPPVSWDRIRQHLASTSAALIRFVRNLISSPTDSIRRISNVSWRELHLVGSPLSRSRRVHFRGFVHRMLWNILKTVRYSVQRLHGYSTHALIYLRVQMMKSITPTQWNYLKRYQGILDSNECLSKRFGGDGCDGRIVHAHMIPRSQLLQISEAGKCLPGNLLKPRLLSDDRRRSLLQSDRSPVAPDP